MNHLDLFSGIGGFALAASWVWGEEHEIHSFVENDPFCQKVLKKHWPDVPIHSDIKEYKHDGATIDLLTGGFPCQPFSQAGKRGGKEDDRYLWPEMLRIIREVQPTWIIGENVAGIINMGLEQVLTDLEDSEYQCQTFLVPACTVNAPHRRDRVWIVANSKNHRQQHSSIEKGCKQPETERGIPVEGSFAWGEPWLEVATRLCGMDARIPNRVDRLKSLGNAIVPQVVVPIMQAIKEIETAI